MKIDSPPFF